MTEEIMPREDRMGKILTFIGGCLAGVIGVFTVAAMSEISSEKRSEENDNLPTVSDEEGILK
jgi:hypothetical protein